MMQPRYTYTFVLETKCGVYNNRDERESARTVPDISQEGEEGLMDGRHLHRLNGTHNN